MFVLIYTNYGASAKRFNARKYYLLKSIITNYNMIINGKSFYDHAIDSDIKRCEKITKLKTGQDEDCTTEFLLDHDYIKSHYRLIAVDLCRKKN